MLRSGTVLEGRYRIGKKIGEGGSGAVYLAAHDRTGRKLAVKEIQKVQQDSREMERTLMLLKELRHPGIPLVMDIVESEEAFFIIMEYMQGENLQKAMNNRKKDGRVYSATEVFEIARGLCEILNYLHTRPEPFLYRDLKPSNILIGGDHSVILVDYGCMCISRNHTEENTAVGTPGYAAPEQYERGAQLGPESDIYSLGATLHYLLTGMEPADTPFFFGGIAEKAARPGTRIGKRERKKVQILERVIQRCTCYQSEKRFHSIDEVRAALVDHDGGFDKGRQNLLLPGILLFLSVIAAGVAFRTEQIGQRLGKEGTAWCLSKAEHSEGETALEWINTALQLSPGNAECFLTALDSMMEDGIFTAEEQEQIRGMLDRVEKGEKEDNETLLRKNPGKFLYFSYYIGTAYYYAAEDRPNYSTAGGWLNEVQRAGELWEPITENGQEEKELLMKRAEILAGICRYRGNQMELTMSTASGGILVEYWEDLTELLKEDIPGGLLLQTEAALWKEILTLLFDWTSELCQEGISGDEQEETVEMIGNLTEKLLSGTEARMYPETRKALEEVAAFTVTVRQKLTNIYKH